MVLLLTLLACSPGKSGGDGDTTTTGTGSATYGSDGAFQRDTVLPVALTMDPDDWDRLRFEGITYAEAFAGDCMDAPFDVAYTTFPADIVMGGQGLSDIGIRKKGLIGSQSTVKPSFRINLDEYVDGVELFGTDNVTLNNSVQDPSYLHQCMTYDLFRAAGLAAPRCNFARVSMNGDDLGIYVHVEPIKRSFLRDWFGNDDGDLYEGTLSDFRETHYRTFDPKNSDTDPDRGPIVALMDALEADSDTVAVLSDWFDIDELMRFIAMENLTGHWDGYAGNTNNFYVYNDPDSGKQRLIPWGADGAMTAAAVQATPFSTGVLANRILDSSAASALHRDAVEGLISSVWDEDAWLAEIDAMADLLETELGSDTPSDAIDDLRAFIEDRPAALLDALPGEANALNPPFCLEDAGQLSASFSTTWGSNDPGDRFWEDEADMSFEWYGTTVPLEFTGVSAGWSGDQGILMIGGVVDLEAEAIVLPYFTFDPASLALGPLVVDGDWTDPNTAGGEVLYTEGEWGGEFTSIGIYGGGELEVSGLDTTDGAPMSGTVSASILAWAEVTPGQDSSAR